jgi:hypothetical protein
VTLSPVRAGVTDPIASVFSRFLTTFSVVVELSLPPGGGGDGRSSSRMIPSAVSLAASTDSPVAFVSPTANVSSGSSTKSATTCTVTCCVPCVPAGHVSVPETEP